MATTNAGLPLPTLDYLLTMMQEMKKEIEELAKRAAKEAPATPPSATPQVVRYINVYGNGYAEMFSYRALADKQAGHGRTECVRITYLPNQFDD